MSPGATKVALSNHPGFAAGLLLRMPAGRRRPEMVTQHHEMPDGGGYPDVHWITAGSALARRFWPLSMPSSGYAQSTSIGWKNRSAPGDCRNSTPATSNSRPGGLPPFNAVIPQDHRNLMLLISNVALAE